jgi:ABC-2 type transport system ATP-binding protein
MIELHHLSKRYGDLTAVNRLSLSVERGEVFGFIGPNGAGKTTTLRMIGGVLAPTEGSVVIGGINMAQEPEKAKRQIGFIPDRPFLYEKLTGMEFLRFTADLYGHGDGVFSAKAERVLKQFSLSDWADELIESYSHGMKQRLLMASTLLHDPEVLVIDEPMVGLDPAGIRMVKKLLRDLAQKGTTIFMSTHTLEVAEDVCDRIGVIHKGVMIAIGTLQELKHRAQIEEGDLEEIFMILTEAEPTV